MRCGVLALQGDWAAHARVLNQQGAEVFEVRTADELASVQALVLPGGESTTMLRLLEAEGLRSILEERVARGLPVLGTCAGLILLAEAVEPDQRSLAVLDVDVTRNAYGRQVHSVVVPIDVGPELGGPSHMEGVFIRAPRITRTGPGVQVLGRRDGEPVIVRQGKIVASTCHPELTGDDRLHRMLVAMGEAEDD